MHLKDYYAILEIETSASATEIKKSFRRLAQQFHPDKNQADPYASAQFTEIKEAYEVLTNPSKKEYYLQQRWYNQSIGKRKKQDTITPVAILKHGLELERHVSTLDAFRMNKQGLEQYILETIRILPTRYSKSVLLQLTLLAATNEDATQQIQSFSVKSNKKHQQEKYSTLIIIGITIIICLLIFLAGR